MGREQGTVDGRRGSGEERGVRFSRKSLAAPPATDFRPWFRAVLGTGGDLIHTSQLCQYMRLSPGAEGRNWCTISNGIKKNRREGGRPTKLRKMP